MPDLLSTPCPLCGSVTSVLNRHHPGYRRPDSYEIRMCYNCDTQFASPATVDGSIYDIIYENADDIRGYARYSIFAKMVLERPDPLGFLADSEDVYWFVEDFLTRSAVPRDAAILEVGSGLGYLTYAIHRRGYTKIRGMDLSAKAVASATRTYGDLYFVGNITTHGETSPDRYDVIILTEVIEHVPDILGLIGAIARLLKPGGAIALTTPNKSSQPPGAYWGTDNPPVHLWWLSESSLRQIAIRLKLSLRLWDFSPYRARHTLGLKALPSYPIRAHMPPYIGADGAILAHPRPSAGKLQQFAKRWLTRSIGYSAYETLKQAVHAPRATVTYIKESMRNSSARGSTMGIVLCHPES